MEKSNSEWAKNIPCRNVIIYGYCKKQTEGCPFRHEGDDDNATHIAKPNNNIASNSVLDKGINEPVADNDTESNAAINENNTLSLKSLQLNSLNQQQNTETATQVIPISGFTSISQLIQPPSSAGSINAGIASSPTPNSVPKFNAKTSASFTPMGGKADLNTETANQNNETTVNSAGLSITGNIAPPLGSIHPVINTLAPSFDAYAARSFTPSASSSNLVNAPGMHSESIENHNQIIQPQGQIAQQPPMPMPFPTQPGMPHPSSSSAPSHYPPFPISQMGGDPTVIGQAPPHFPQANLGLKYPIIYPPPHSLLQYHLYAPDPPPHFNLSLKPNEQLPESLFIPNNLRIDLVKKNMAALQIFPPGGLIPDIVQDYFGLVSLDFHKQEATNVGSQSNHFFGHKSSLYKVFSNVDGNVYLMRRIHDAKAIDPTQLAQAYQEWSSVSSTNIVKLKDLFTTTKFGDTSLCAIYDYYPLASSLYETHFVTFPLEYVTQDYLWLYLTQITTAMKAIHSKGLYIGDSLNWNKIIVTGKPGRIKVVSSEVFKILDPNNLHNNSSTSTTHSNDVIKEQQADFRRLGELLNKLSNAIKPSPQSLSNNDTNSSGDLTNAKNKSNFPKIDELSVDENFKEVLKYLLDDSNTKKNIKELSHIFSDKLFELLDSSQSLTEYTESVLSKELENGRLFRLICKLNCIFGRMESRVDINWSDSGEKFPIILFYDYVFHQVDETGKPFVDLTHILRCLNKLDSGVAEKIMLVTPDEMNCIIISYKELKDLVETTFRSLTQ
ncbi:hypothetical protein TPHA_0N01920 [Tetrapisispora phaffii CBS 4417]|uniref:PAN2-PAN3 deadenylation complex subunit PAN3 n=1 Tax=Tetrapisispora phaffii (strain ATCC 24235 / CBS 4417 / NBRC 1672 / NRRL Y-8282 / UCD 70-5) TaxID=1071381 RepID=G8C1E5_TETPH|nr:hypothetical protein TPHA_0N01920 [Tetrapisispora phaffii CBS 4417]CCE65973.1 hypothetical protein TPHA_0N01920 [Tetrapisispora phaffii CBS 4417]